MDTTFLTPPPPYDHVRPSTPRLLIEAPAEDQPQLKRRRSPSFLSSVRHLIPRPLKRSRSPAFLDIPKSADRISTPSSAASSRASSPVSLTGRHSHCCVHSGSCEASCIEPVHSQARSRRPYIPSMIDYLTLEQLETMWRRQDTYKGTVDAPRTTDDLDLLMSARPADTEPRPQSSRSELPMPPRYHPSEHYGGSRWYAGVSR